MKHKDICEKFQFYIELLKINDFASFDKLEQHEAVYDPSFLIKNLGSMIYVTCDKGQLNLINVNNGNRSLLPEVSPVTLTEEGFGPTSEDFAFKVLERTFLPDNTGQIFGYYNPPANSILGLHCVKTISKVFTIYELLEIFQGKLVCPFTKDGIIIKKYIFVINNIPKILYLKSEFDSIENIDKNNYYPSLYILTNKLLQGLQDSPLLKQQNISEINFVGHSAGASISAMLAETLCTQLLNTQLNAICFGPIPYQKDSSMPSDYIKNLYNSKNLNVEIIINNHDLVPCLNFMDYSNKYRIPSLEKVNCKAYCIKSKKKGKMIDVTIVKIKKLANDISSISTSLSLLNNAHNVNSYIINLQNYIIKIDDEINYPENNGNDIIKQLSNMNFISPDDLPSVTQSLIFSIGANLPVDTLRQLSGIAKNVGKEAVSSLYPESKETSIDIINIKQVTQVTSVYDVLDFYTVTGFANTALIDTTSLPLGKIYYNDQDSKFVTIDKQAAAGTTGNFIGYPLDTGKLYRYTPVTGTASYYKANSVGTAWSAWSPYNTVNGALYRSLDSKFSDKATITFSKGASNVLSAIALPNDHSVKYYLGSTTQKIGTAPPAGVYQTADGTTFTPFTTTTNTLYNFVRLDNGTTSFTDTVKNTSGLKLGSDAGLWTDASFRLGSMYQVVGLNQALTAVETKYYSATSTSNLIPKDLVTGNYYGLSLLDNPLTSAVVEGTIVLQKAGSTSALQNANFADGSLYFYNTNGGNNNKLLKGDSSVVARAASILAAKTAADSAAPTAVNAAVKAATTTALDLTGATVASVAAAAKVAAKAAGARLFVAEAIERAANGPKLADLKIALDNAAPASVAPAVTAATNLATVDATARIGIAGAAKAAALAGGASLSVANAIAADALTPLTAALAKIAADIATPNGVAARVIAATTTALAVTGATVATVAAAAKAAALSAGSGTAASARVAAAIEGDALEATTSALAKTAADGAVPDGLAALITAATLKASIDPIANAAKNAALNAHPPASALVAAAIENTVKSATTAALAKTAAVDAVPVSVAAAIKTATAVAVLVAGATPSSVVAAALAAALAAGAPAGVADAIVLGAGVIITTAAAAKNAADLAAPSIGMAATIATATTTAATANGATAATVANAARTAASIRASARVANAIAADALAATTPALAKIAADGAVSDGIAARVIAATTTALTVTGATVATVAAAAKAAARSTAGGVTPASDAVAAAIEGDALEATTPALAKIAADGAVPDGLAALVDDGTRIAYALSGATVATVATAAKEAALGATREVAKAIYDTAIAASTTAFNLASSGADFADNGGVNASPPVTLSVNNKYNFVEASSSMGGENECSCY